jgi:hypothetical protein
LSLVVGSLLWGAVSPVAAQPIGWITVGGHAALETGHLSNILGVETAVLANVGFHLWRLGPFLLGVDAEGTAGRVPADLGAADDTITVYRARGGLRFTWWLEHEEPYLVPYARVGAAYRRDRGSLIRDEGVGWYASVGLDFRLSDTWSIGPFATYESVSLSIDTETFLFGLGLTFSY